MTQRILATRPAKGLGTLTPAWALCSTSHILLQEFAHYSRGAGSMNS